MRDRLRFTFTFVVPFILLMVSGSGPVATANPLGPTYTLIDLGTLGGPLGSEALGINARGQVVGWSDAGAAQPHAFLWEAGTGMQDLGFGMAHSINARGQVVGWSNSASGEIHAFLWEAGTRMQDLGTLGGFYSVALGINAPGQVVGYAQTAAGEPPHAFLWEAGTGMQDLGAGVAQGINARGQIVGRDSGRAVLWRRGSE